MKRIFIVLILLLSCLTDHAQVQQGVVKTHGRLQEDGSYRPGKRISDAVVSIKDGNDYVSDMEGEFSFVVSELGRYRISQVAKSGYLLTDMDVLTRDHTCAETPVYILLESEDEWQNYRRTIERKVRTNYQNKIYAMQDELEQLRQEGKTSHDELVRMQKEIDDVWEKAEKYVKTMSERYLRIDYDYEPEFYRKVGSLILNGELERADSMLFTKGNLSDRVSKGLAYRKSIDRFNEENAKLCDCKCDIFSQMNMQDSVGYYLGLKASLDPENVEWQLDAVKHRAFVLYDYDQALDTLNSVLKRVVSEDDLKHYAPQIYCAQGDIFREIEKYEDAMSCYESAMSYYLERNNERGYLETFIKKGYVPSKVAWNRTRPELIPIYTGMAVCLTELSVFKKGYDNKYVGVYGTNYAFDLYCLAMMICEHLYGADDYRTAEAYYQFASWQNMLGDFRTSSRFCKKIIGILTRSNAASSLLASTYLMMGRCYAEKGKYDSALEYTQKAYDTYLSVDNNLDVTDIPPVLEAFGNIYMLKKDYKTSIGYYMSALESMASIYGGENIKMARLYNNIGYVYAEARDREKALNYLNRSYELRKSYLGEENVFTNITRDNIEYVNRNITD